MPSMNLKSFRYKFDKGPLLLKDLKKEDFEEGNCRLAVQYYLYKKHRKYFKSNLILNPNAYKRVGKFIINEDEFDKDSLSKLREGDIIYAHKIRKEDIDIDRKNWIIRLHTAIYCGSNKIYHSSLIDNGSNFWTFNKFTKYYKPIAVKRVLE